MAKEKAISIWDPKIMTSALGDSFLKLSTQKMMGNPVMFVVEVGSVITTILLFRDIAKGVRIADGEIVQPTLHAGVVNLHTSLKLNQWASAFVNVDNLLNRTYYTFGTFTQLDNLPPGVNLTDPRTLSPSPGRVAYAGVRITF